MTRWRTHSEVAFRWPAEIVVTPTRKPLGRGPCWTSGAEVRFWCPRCGSSLIVAVDVEWMNRGDPNDNQLLGTRGDSYTYFAEVRDALRPLDSHVCIPGLGSVNLNASRHEQYEALSVLFAEMAEATR